MAYYNDIKEPSALERALTGVAYGLEKAAVLHARHRIYRASLKELRALGDRELEDLGLSRHALKDLTRQAALKHTGH